jgi:hypothetical protein
VATINNLSASVYGLTCHAEERGICRIEHERPLLGRETLLKGVHTLTFGGEQVFKHYHSNDPGVGYPIEKMRVHPPLAKTHPWFSYNAVTLNLLPCDGGDVALRPWFTYVPNDIC